MSQLSIKSRLTQSDYFKSEILPWVVCLSAGLFFFYDFVQLNVMSSIGSYLITEYKLSATQLGNLAAMYLYAQLTCLFLSGYLLDRISTRKIILTGMIICVISTFWFAWATDLWMLHVARAMCGATAAFCFLSCIMLATRWFPPQKMATITGVIVTMAMWGGAMAQRPMDMMVLQHGWRQAVYINAIVGLFLFMWMFYFVQDGPAKRTEKKETLPLTQTLRIVLSSRQNWCAAWYTALMNSVVFVLGAVWGSQYLMKVHHCTQQDATAITMMIFFGTMIGSPLVGWLSDKISLRRAPMVLGAVLSFVVMVILMLVNQWSHTALYIIFFLLGLLTSTQIITYPVIFESNDKRIIGMCESFAAVIILGVGAVLLPLFGVIMDILNPHANLVYTSSDYQAALCLFPICFLISICLSWFLTETHCKRQEEIQTNG